MKIFIYYILILFFMIAISSCHRKYLTVTKTIVDTTYVNKLQVDTVVVTKAIDSFTIHDTTNKIETKIYRHYDTITVNSVYKGDTIYKEIVVPVKEYIQVVEKLKWRMWHIITLSIIGLIDFFLIYKTIRVLTK